MPMKDILKMLNVEALDESVQSQVKDKINSIIDEKANTKAEVIAAETISEKVKAAVDEATESTINDLETKFDDYKLEISEKFSDFVDGVIEEELEIPKNILEYAHKGEVYSDLIDQFKIRLSIDEGVLDEEAKGLLKEANDELDSKDEKINSLMAENIDLKADNKDMAISLYINEKCEGFTSSQRDKMSIVLEGLKTQEQIDEKFELVKGLIIESKKEDDYEDEEGTGDMDDEDMDEKKKSKKKKMEEEKSCKKTNEGLTQDDNVDLIDENAKKPTGFQAYINEAADMLNNNTF